MPKFSHKVAIYQFYTPLNEKVEIPELTKQA